jgi:hypothetical protein
VAESGLDDADSERVGFVQTNLVDAPDQPFMTEIARALGERYQPA